MTTRSICWSTRRCTVWPATWPSWPAGVVDADGPYELLLQRAGMVSMAHVRRYDLPDGYHLLIGRDVKLRAQLRALLTDALLWAMLMALVMASVGALIIRNLFRRTLANISATATAIAAGDFAQRVRLSGRGDEFDQLAEVINDMLDRIGRLMDGVRQVSNAIAHDLRTPITRARTRLEDAALHAETRDDLRAAIERATADLDGIVAVFQALLRIAQIEAGSRRSAFAPVDVVPLLAEVADLYEAVAEERSIALRVQAPAARDGLRRPRADPAGGRQPRRQCREVFAIGRGGRSCRHRRRSGCRHNLGPRRGHP